MQVWSDPSERKIKLVEEGFDLALRVASTLDDILIARQQSAVNFLLVASPEFLYRTGRPESVDAMSDAPLLLYSPMGEKPGVGRRSVF